MAEAPVAMMTVRVSIFCSWSTVIVNGCLRNSTAVTSPVRKVVPNRSACARISFMRSGPMIPLAKPGKFSTSVVVVSCPPDCQPSMRRGAKLARAAYTAAVRPAGPEPMMSTWCMGSI